MVASIKINLPSSAERYVKWYVMKLIFSGANISQLPCPGPALLSLVSVTKSHSDKSALIYKIHLMKNKIKKCRQFRGGRGINLFCMKC